MRLKRQVVMLPTEKASTVKLSEKNGLDYSPAMMFLKEKEWVNQYIYILSDEKIENCWFVDIYINKVYHSSTHVPNENCKKIIATTDKYLTTLFIPTGFKSGVGALSHSKQIPLPQPSQQFIEKYVEEYNKGNIITDVMVEYESYHGIKTSIAEINAISGDGSMNWKGLGDDRDFKLKVNLKDNAITIRKVKNSWSREEVIKIIDYCWGYKNESIQTKSEWIEQNL